MEYTDYFSDLTDPRVERCKKHSLSDILMLTLCAVLGGAEDFEQVANYGSSKQEFLRTFLSLPNGIPSHDTLNRVFSRLDPKELGATLARYGKELMDIVESKQICIDGKKMRGANPGTRGVGGLWVVSAWAADQRLVLGQEKVSAKSNEKTAIPELLEVLDLEGAVVTIDAIGCQQSIAEQIIAKEGDYVLAVKGNSKKLCKQVTTCVTEELKASLPSHRQLDADHGRFEQRDCYVLSDLALIDEAKQWTGAKSIVIIEAQRNIKGQEQVEKQTRFYLSSLCETPENFNHIIRSHWSIENHLHWMLDVVFKEDQSRLRKGNAPENMNTIRKTALQMLTRMKDPKSLKLSIKNRSKRAGWDDEYLLQILRQQ